MNTLTATHDLDTEFTLDEALLARRREQAARRMHQVLIPRLRLVGFGMLCVLALLHDLRLGAEPFLTPGLFALIGLNLGYALLAGAAMRRWYGRTGRVDLSLVLMHLDVLVWLVTLYRFEHTHLFFAYLLLMRVADQLGFGFRRALYFSVLLPLTYLVYGALVARIEPELARWPDRLGIAVVMLLLGLYLSITGLVVERMRRRQRQAVRAARDMVVRLEQQAQDLDQARLQAEQASVAKSQFLATMSHEIRTPMHGILGATELLVDGSLPSPQQQQLAKAAHRSATALLGLIDDVLDLTRIEGGRLELRPTAFDPRTLVKEAVELFAGTARAKPVTVSATLAPELPAQLEGDPARLRQLLVNLLHNALKFTERGSVEVHVAVLEQTARAARLRLEVRDTGVGIDETQLDSVFDRFTQGDASSTRRHRGSGLGLAIVKELAEAMGARVGVESRVGEGSVFWFEIALAKPPAPPRGRADAAPQPGAPRGPRRVLVVEDEPVNQLVVQQMLLRLGCEVTIAGDGAQALAALRHGAFDLVLMDLHMPVMDGIEATRRLREHEAGQSPPTTRLPVVAVTADTLAGDRERCLRAGMDDVLTKPVGAAQLQEAVTRWTGA